MRSYPGFCIGLGLAMDDAFGYFLLETFSFHLVFLPDKKAQCGFILQLVDTCKSHLLTPRLSVKHCRNFSPQTTIIQAPLTASMPLREAANIKDLPSPSKSLGCHRSSTTCLQTKHHLWQAKGIYCLSFEEFCSQGSPARAWRHADMHTTYTIGSRRKGPTGAWRVLTWQF